MNGSKSISDIKKIIGVFAVSLLFFTSTNAQNIIGVVDYLKVDNTAQYLEAEKIWKKVQEERLNENMIIGWVLYQVMFKTTEDPYNYISLTLYDSFSKLDKGIPESVFTKALPEMDKNEWKETENKINASSKLTASGVFHQRLSCNEALDLTSNYYVISEINVKPGKSSEYMQMKEDIYKPVYRESFLRGKISGWSLWEKWPGNMKDFQYVDANGYVSLEQIDNSNFKESFNKVHPNENMEQIGKNVEELSTLVNTEMWKIIYRVLK